MTEEVETLQRIDDKVFRLQRLIDRLDELPHVQYGHLCEVEAHLADLISRLACLLGDKP